MHSLRSFRPSKLCCVTRRHAVLSRLSTQSCCAITRRQHYATEPAELTVLDLLDQRGHIKDFAGDRDVFRKALRTRPVGIYAGIDPTAPSLHLGHLLPLMVLFWFYIHGHNPVSLIGGATAQIGDPSGRLTSRQRTASATHTTNTEALTTQVDGLWHKLTAYAKRHGYEASSFGTRKLLDNREWLLQLNIVDFLKSLGSNMRIGAMLGRDTVKNKMENGDGMSFAEFSYPLLQGWDWWHMFDKHGVQLQVGGSDQFGNIIAGLDAVKVVAQTAADGQNWAHASGAIRHNHTPMGLTTPLLTTASGEKFGKSAGNAVWLNAEMTAPFDLYGFLLRTADTDVERYLKLFTLVPLETIAATMTQHQIDPSARHAQHLLAAEILELVHGREEAEKARRGHASVRSASSRFGEGAEAFNLREAERAFVPHHMLTHNASFAHILFHAGLAASKSQATRLIDGGGAYVASNYTPDCANPRLEFKPMKGMDIYDCGSLTKGVLVVRLGKWKVRVIEGLTTEHERRPQEGSQNIPP